MRGRRRKLYGSFFNHKSVPRLPPKENILCDKSRKSGLREKRTISFHHRIRPEVMLEDQKVGMYGLIFVLCS